MAVEINPELERLLREEKIAWLTTRRGDGMPLPAPMWFLWQDNRFLFYSQPKPRGSATSQVTPELQLT